MDGMLPYLADLEMNNKRDWYHENKARYKQAMAEFEDVVDKLIVAIGGFDPSVLHNSAKDLTFKLVRDTRFSHDKSPYNPAFRAHIAANGKQPVPVGYFLKIAPGCKSFLGGGLFASMFKDATVMIRDYLSIHPKEFESIITDEQFTRLFKVEGEALKNVPKGYDPTHPLAEFIKHKSWYLEYPVADSELLYAESFVQKAAGLFCLMKPFNDYLNTALVDFRMPSR